MLLKAARLLAVCLLTCVAACGGPAADPLDAPPARPALWRVSDADTTIYLFGAIHMLPPDAKWRSPAVDQAFAGSRAVYFEADVEGDPAAQAAMVRRLGLLDPPQRLPELLDRDHALALAAAAGRVGYAREALEQQRPWFAAVVLADAAMREAGYALEAGTETVLRRDALASGKAVRFLETMEGQLSILAGLPQDVQIAFLNLTVADMSNAPASLSAMVNAWRTGDVDALGRLLIDDDMARLPAVRTALLTDRNAAWARQIETLLTREPGQFFIAVGAAHLAGGDSVQEQLDQLGLAVERVQ